MQEAPPRRFHLNIKRELVGEYLILSSLAALVGVIAGLIALGFRYLIWIFLSVFHSGGVPYGEPWLNPAIFNLDAGHFYPALTMERLLLFVLLPVGGLLVGLITTYLAPEVKGAGTPQVMEAVLARGGNIRPRVVALKSLASAITIGSGGSAGREGPIVQIGAAAGSSIAQALRLAETPRRILLACGAAGAIAATFNAPIAGVVFSLELVLLEFRTRSFIPLVISAVFASAVAGLFLTTGPLLPAEYTFVSPIELTFFVVLGLVCGFAAILWIRVRFWVGDALDQLHVPAYVKPALGLGLLAPLAIFFPQIMGVGYSTIRAALVGDLGGTGAVHLGIAVLLTLALLKVVGTSLTLGSGGSGGAFAPSLFIGAMVGGALGLGFNALYPEITNPFGAYALVGMGALFAGASRATLTSIVIVFELTGDYKFVLPLMLACVVADGVSMLLQRDTLYTGVLRRRGILFEPEAELNVLRTIRVEDAMVKEVATVKEDTLIHDVAREIHRTGHQGFPVLNGEGHMVGIITHSDVRRALSEGKRRHPVQEVETQKLVVATPTEDLEVALEKMAVAEVGHLPVVSEEDPSKLVGILSRGDIVRAYQRKALEERHGIYGDRRQGRRGRR